MNVNGDGLVVESRNDLWVTQRPFFHFRAIGTPVHSHKNHHRPARFSRGFEALVHIFLPRNAHRFGGVDHASNGN